MFIAVTSCGMTEAVGNKAFLEKAGRKRRANPRERWATIRQEKNQQICQVDYLKPEYSVHLINPEHFAADLLHPPKDRTAQHGQSSGECHFCSAR